MDKLSAERLASAMRADMKANKRASQGAKYIDKHDANPSMRNVKKLGKIKDKMTAAYNERDRQRSSLDIIRSQQQKLVNDIVSSGYLVSSKKVIRMTKFGERYATQMLAGVIGQAAVTTSMAKTYGDRYAVKDDKGRQINQTPWMILGNKYKVN
jgi:transglutaminase/protease-like cytokinesis protein 3